jgi:penicillin-binding protein 1A
MGVPRRVCGLVVGAVTLVASGCASLPADPIAQADRKIVAASTQLYASDGSLLTLLHGEIDRQPVLLKEVPDTLQDAAVAIEDETFWTHHGVSLRGVARAAVSNAKRAEAGTGHIQGGSTISQQLVKNMYFPSGERTITRKLAEARLALGLERRYSKPKILEMYLNTVYFGRGAYGVRAAARAYFKKDMASLSLGESAFLAGLIHDPEAYNWTDQPSDSRDARKREALTRRDLVLDRMVKIGSVTPDAARAAKTERLEVVPQDEQRWPHPYFVDLVLRELGVTGAPGRKLDPRYNFLGSTVAARARRVYEGGLRIYTTIDPNAQTAAESAVATVLPARLTKLSAALIALDPSTGFVRAIIGGKDYYSTGTPHARVNLALGAAGGGSGRQPGSSFKPFVLAAALQRGVSLRRSYDSSPFEYRLDRYQDPWKVSNYEGEGGGSINLVDGTVHSVNAVYAHLLIDGVGGGDAFAGAERVASLARSLGIPFATEDDLRQRCKDRYLKTNSCIPASKVPAIALGAKEVAPFDVAGAYAAFANGGKRIKPTSIVRIEDRNGKSLYAADPHPEQAIPAPIADAVTNVLTGVIQRGTGARADIDRPAAGKTGTSQMWRDAWFDGYVPQLLASVWVGNPSMQESMTPSNGYPFRVVGGTFPAMIWRAFMRAALRGVPVEPFPPMPGGFSFPDASEGSSSGPPASAPVPSFVPQLPGFPGDFFAPRGRGGLARTPRPPRTPRPAGRRGFP